MKQTDTHRQVAYRQAWHHQYSRGREGRDQARLGQALDEDIVVTLKLNSFFTGEATAKKTITIAAGTSQKSVTDAITSIKHNELELIQKGNLTISARTASGDVIVKPSTLTVQLREHTIWKPKGDKSAGFDAAKDFAEAVQNALSVSLNFSLKGGWGRLALQREFQTAMETLGKWLSAAEIGKREV